MKAYTPCQTDTDVHNKGMYLRPIYRDKDGKRHAYWALMKSVRTSRSPRSHVVAYLGALPETERRGVAEAAEGGGPV